MFSAYQTGVVANGRIRKRQRNWLATSLFWFGVTLFVLFVQVTGLRISSVELYGLQHLELCRP